VSEKRRGKSSDPQAVDAPNIAADGVPASAPPAHSAASDHIGSPMQDSSDVDIRSISRFLIAMVVSLAVVAGLVYYQVVWLADRQEESRPPAAFRAGERLPPPAPILQTSARDDMRRLRAAQEKALTQSGWIDRDRGLVRIPIDRAMKRLVEKGLPDWPPVAPDASATGTRPAGAPTSTVVPLSTPAPLPTASPSPTPTTSATPSGPRLLPIAPPTGSPSPTQPPEPQP
jgi:hypothetical protein